jgi:hypothetical protein
MSRSRNAVHRDVERLMACGQEVRALLLANNKGFAKGLKMLDKGTPINEILAKLNTAEHRTETTDLLNEFDARRHQLRQSIIAAGLEEGMSISDLGRAFGISRQLAQRLAKESMEQSLNRPA